VSGAAIGSVTHTRRVRVLDAGELVGDMAVSALVDDCPLYDLDPVKPAAPLYEPPAATLSMDATPRQALLALLASANLASRRPLFEQYDAIVQSRTVRRPEQADAAVLALHPPGSATAASPGAGSASAAEAQEPVAAVAVSIDCNGRRVAADPYRGTVAAVLECASNLACAGGEPLGTTNNLNFGNPEKRHIAWQLTESVRGLRDACRALQAPIVGGNVSLYNEGATGPIYPTPVIGMVGRLPDARRAGRLGFQSAGEQIALVGSFSPSLAAGELEKLRGRPLPDGLAEVDIDAVRAAQTAVRDAVRAGTLSSAHDIAEGGLAIALAECCLAGEVGASVLLRDDFWETIRVDAPGPRSSSPVSALVTAALFGEGAGGFIVSGHRDALRELGKGAPVLAIGTVGGEELRIEIAAGADGESPNAGEAAAIAVSLSELAAAHSSLGELFG
jgi:phosphoribosylformylglycinamidine synthase subunit PurL